MNTNYATIIFTHKHDTESSGFFYHITLKCVETQKDIHDALLDIAAKEEKNGMITVHSVESNFLNKDKAAWFEGKQYKFNTEGKNK